MDHANCRNAFLPTLPFFRRRASDREHVEKLAKSLRWWDRWRWLAICFHVSVLVGVVWFGFYAVELLGAFQNPWPGIAPDPKAVVLIGTIVGLKVGFLLHGSATGVLNALSGFRTERLLVESFNKQHGITPDSRTP